MSPGLVQFSPDSSRAAWEWVDYLYIPLNYESSLLQTAYVQWCSTEQPKSVRSVRLLSVGPDYGGYDLGGLVHLSFSPDSRHLAVAAPYMLKVIDLAEGRCWSLAPAGEIVSSLAWLSSGEIGYAAHTSLRGRYHDTTDRTFWRQRIHAPATTRVAIHRDEGLEAGFYSRLPSFGWPLEYWSPKGTYVLYQPTCFGRMQVLDVQEGRVRPVGREDLYFQAVAWKDDESVVACIGGVRGVDRQHVALLIEPRTLSILDFSEPFVENLKDPWPFLQTAWTPDGRYLLINDLHAGGCVVQPAPFRCIRIAERLPSSFNQETGQRYMAHVHPLPIGGWIRARDPDSVGYLVDYEGETILRLGQISGTWSEDGTMAGECYDKRLHLQHIQLPVPCSQPVPISTGAKTENPLGS